MSPASVLVATLSYAFFLAHPPPSMDRWKPQRPRTDGPRDYFGQELGPQVQPRALRLRPSPAPTLAHPFRTAMQAPSLGGRFQHNNQSSFRGPHYRDFRLYPCLMRYSTCFTTSTQPSRLTQFNIHRAKTSRLIYPDSKVSRSHSSFASSHPVRPQVTCRPGG